MKVSSAVKAHTYHARTEHKYIRLSLIQDKQGTKFGIQRRTLFFNTLSFRIKKFQRQRT